MVIQPIPSGNNLWVLLEVLQPLHCKMLGKNKLVNLEHLQSEYSETFNYFKFLDFKGLELLLSVVGKNILCVLMQNARTYLYSNTSS